MPRGRIVKLMPRTASTRQIFQCMFSDCGYSWRTRRDTPPARCPGCQRTNWLAGDRALRAIQQELSPKGEGPPTSPPAATAAAVAE